MKFPCVDCPYLEPDCPTIECIVYAMWAWEDTCDDE